MKHEPPALDAIHQGDVLAVLRSWPAEFVQTVVTSPPYWALRDYGTAGQMGLEATPEAYVRRIVRIFREIRRVLRKDGTIWVNLGDTYNSGPAGARDTNRWPKQGGANHQPKRMRTGALKPKDLVGIPWRVALALQADGWYLRADIIWAKPNPMPESVRDRPTKAHEYLFLMAKSRRYFYNAAAIREPIKEASIARLGQDLDAQAGSDRANAGGKTNGRMKAVAKWPAGWADHNGEKHDLVGRYQKPARFGGDRADGHIDHRKSGNEWKPDGLTANKKTIWSVPTQGFREAHFATFPEDLIEPCILAGANEGGIVLDPFIGSGTTAVVARRWKRRWLGIEINPAYVAIAQKRIDTELEPLIVIK